jgi:hypothetical protein
VGRSGLDPGTLGLKGTSKLYWGVTLVDVVVELLTNVLLRVGIVCLISRGVWDVLWDAQVVKGWWLYTSNGNTV